MNGGRARFDEPGVKQLQTMVTTPPLVGCVGKARLDHVKLRVVCAGRVHRPCSPLPLMPQDEGKSATSRVHVPVTAGPSDNRTVTAAVGAARWFGRGARLAGLLRRGAR